MSDEGLLPPSLQVVGLGHLLRERRRSYPDNEAVVCGTTRLGYAELDRRVDQLAGVLESSGVAIGGRVLWLGQNCHQLWETLLAAARLGAICCPVNWRLTPAEARLSTR